MGNCLINDFNYDEMENTENDEQYFFFDTFKELYLMSNNENTVVIDSIKILR